MHHPPSAERHAQSARWDFTACVEQRTAKYHTTNQIPLMVASCTDNGGYRAWVREAHWVEDDAEEDKRVPEALPHTHLQICSRHRRRADQSYPTQRVNSRSVSSLVKQTPTPQLDCESLGPAGRHTCEGEAKPRERMKGQGRERGQRSYEQPVLERGIFPQAAQPCPSSAQPASTPTLLAAYGRQLKLPHRMKMFGG